MALNMQEKVKYNHTAGVALGRVWLEVNAVSDLVDSSSVYLSFLRTRVGKVIS